MFKESKVYSTFTGSAVSKEAVLNGQIVSHHFESEADHFNYRTMWKSVEEAAKRKQGQKVLNMEKVRWG